MVLDTKIIDKAVLFATKAHSGSGRKFSTTPYIVHPVEAMAIAATITSDQEVLAATVLHDVVEDTGISIDEIRKEFGDKVAELVLTETEDKRKNLPAESTWRIRKEESIALLENTDDLNVKILWIADKLSNMRSFYRLYLEKGIDFWNMFHNNNVSEQKWYYEAVLNATRELSDTVAWKEYNDLLNKIFASAE